MPCNEEEHVVPWMIMTVVLEDGTLKAGWVHERWAVTLGNIVTGETFEALWTPRELGAVLELAIAGEDIAENESDESVLRRLYAIAEPLFAPPCPVACRLIP